MGRRAGFFVFVVLALLAAPLIANVEAAEPNIVVNGHLEQAYADTFAELSYTRDSGQEFTGLLSVVEGDEWFYFGFQQNLSAKSNAYCGDKKSASGCSQDFKALHNSDYLSFEWGNLYVPVDIITSSSKAGGVSTPSGYVGRVGTGDGGDLDGANPADVQGFSAMDYNMNVLGWVDTENSPNFAGQSNAPYIYPSIAEVAVRKSAFPAGEDPRNPTVVVHNSPGGRASSFKEIHISCPSNAGGNVGDEVSLTLTVTDNSVPVANQNVLVILDGPGTVKSVGGTPGNRGKTGSNGQAVVVVTSDTPVTTQVRGVVDLDDDGQWDQATEPTTEPTCPVTWDQPPLKPAINIEKDGPQESRVGEVITYRMVVTIPIDIPLTNVRVTDPDCDDPPKLISKDNGDKDDTLEFGEEWRYTCPREIESGDPDPLPNTATATGVGPNGQQVEDDDSHLVRLVPGPLVKIEKDGPQKAAVGDTITYRLAVSIPVDRPLHDVVVTDSRCDTQPRLRDKVGGNSDNILELGELWVYECKYEVRPGDVPDFRNVAHVEGRDERGRKATDEDDHKVRVDRVKRKVVVRPPAPSGRLPFTGSNPNNFMITALMLIVAGAGALLFSRIDAARVRRASARK